MTSWGHDPTSVYVSNLLLTVNDALTHSAVLIQVYHQIRSHYLPPDFMLPPPLPPSLPLPPSHCQAHGWKEDGQVEHIPFPFDRDEEVPIPDDDPLNHPCLRVLEREMDISHTCGYLTMLRTGGSGIVHNLYTVEPPIMDTRRTGQPTCT